MQTPRETATPAEIAEINVLSLGSEQALVMVGGKLMGSEADVFRKKASRADDFANETIKCSCEERRHCNQQISRR
jgi:hypothetical protein